MLQIGPSLVDSCPTATPTRTGPSVCVWLTSEEATLSQCESVRSVFVCVCLVYEYEAHSEEATLSQCESVRSVFVCVSSVRVRG